MNETRFKSRYAKKCMQVTIYVWEQEASELEI